MLKSTEQKAIEFVKSKGGVVEKIVKEKENHYYNIICELGHHFNKEKRKLLYSEQYCTYYPCNKGKKTEWRDKLGFKLFKSRLKEIFDDDIICIEPTPQKSKKFLFKCNKCGHEWSNAPSNQITTPPRKNRPPSCKECGGSSPKTEKEKVEYLKELNIQAIDGISSIKNQKTSFYYQCKNKKCLSKGYKTLNNLLNLKKNKLGHCDCTYKRTHWTLKKIIKFGKENGYSFEGKTNSNGIYKWKCKEGHITSFGLSSLVNGCLTCFNNKRFMSLNDIDEWLKTNESTIKLIPNQNWEGSNLPYEFHCSICNKDFSRHFHSMLSGSLCPNQSRSYSEIVVEFYLEKLLGIKFVSNKKYDFLKNSNGNNMELDGYNIEHKIAFEHHGIQHYEEGVFHNERNALDNRKKDDEIKRKQCKLNNIRLIEIDVLFDYTPIEKLKETIKEKLILLEIDIPKNFDKINPKLKELNIYHKKNK